MDSNAFSHLWLLLERNRPVAIHSHLIPLMGSAKAALFLSQLVYWTRRSPAAPQSLGWVHKTTAQWFHELGLSRREQESARTALKAVEVLEEALCGQPALRYYRLKLPKLGNLLLARAGLSAANVDPDVVWADELLVRELLGRALPYHRILAYLTGSVNAALLLTRVIFQHRRHLHAHGWFRFSRVEMERDLGLTRWELDTARERLRGTHFVEEHLAHLPTRLYARAVPPVITDALRRLESALAKGAEGKATLRKSANRIVGISVHRGTQNRQADSRQSRQFGCTKTAAQLGGKPPLSLAENLLPSSRLTTGVHLTTEDLTTTTIGVAGTLSPVSSADVSVVVVNDHIRLDEQVEPQDRLTVRQAEASPPAHSDTHPGCEASTNEALVFPAAFLPDERDSAAVELAALPADRAQLVLDEVEGRIRKQRSVHTRVGLVRCLAQAEHHGRFRPAYAWEVRATRQRAAQREAERHACESRDRAHAAEFRHHLAACARGKTGYEAFKEFTVHWPRLRAAIPDQNKKEDLA